MHIFDEKKLKKTLSRMSHLQRATFATSCAQRISPLFKAYYKNKDDVYFLCLDEILCFLWNSLIDKKDFAVPENLFKLLEPFIEDSAEDDYTPERGAADDAAGSAYYALRCFQLGAEGDALWAARRVYEMLDEHVSNQINSRSYDETAISSHVLIQKELQVQDDELKIIQNHPDFVRELRKNSETTQINSLKM